MWNDRKPVWDARPQGLQNPAHAMAVRGPTARGPSLLHVPINRVVQWIVALFPIWLMATWLSGLTLFAVLLTCAVCLFAFSRLNHLELATLATALCLSLGIGLALFLGQAEGREMSSFYHIIHWGFLICFMHVGRRMMQSADQTLWIDRLSKAAFISMLIMTIYMLVVAWMMTKNPTVIYFPSLVVGRLAPDLTMLSGYSNVIISKINEISGGSEWRLIGFGLWTSEGAYLAVIIGLLAMVFAGKRYGVAAILLLEAAIFVTVGLTGSRTTILGFLLSMAAWLLLAARHWRLVLVAMTPLFFGGLVFFVVIGMDLLIDAIHKASEFRQASSGTRFASYITAWQLTMERNPITGLGFTVLMPELIHVPVGSHSSWTSILIRGGFLAVFCFLWMQILLVHRLKMVAATLIRQGAHKSWQDMILPIILMRGVIVTLLWWLTEDLDGPAAGVAFAGLILGLFWGWQAESAALPRSNTTLSKWR